MMRLIAVAVVMVGLTLALAAQQDTKSDPATVSGVWQMNIQGDHVFQIGMELKQDGTKVTGTILMPTQNVGQRKEVSLTGEFADGALTLTGTAKGGSQDTAKIEVAAKMQKDGTMSGTLSAGTHSAPWSGERLGR
jgi:hypothetical protein